MQIDKHEFSDILFLAFRYCIGRMTYVVQDMHTYIKKHGQHLSNKNKSLMRKEIRTALDHGHAGMECDRQIWEDVLRLLGK